jgi:Rps23 Pro-64 3,4-dihydroxylase Tpa1-like proline 4-hydroxylase
LKFEINKNLKTEELRKKFLEHKTIVIEDFLSKESADLLYNFFTKKMPEDWWYTSMRASKTISYNKISLTRRLPKNLKKIKESYPLIQKALASGRFAYIFDRTSSHAKGCKCVKCRYERFISSPAVLEFFNYITEEPCMKRGEFFASRFTTGQFLGPHHDINKGKIGMVYSLTKDWRPEYGGNLYILKKDYKTIQKVVVSTFNRLALFSIPAQNGIPHFVSQVASEVVVPRLSITGWLK